MNLAKYITVLNLTLAFITDLWHLAHQYFCGLNHCRLYIAYPDYNTSSCDYYSATGKYQYWHHGLIISMLWVNKEKSNNTLMVALPRAALPKIVQTDKVFTLGLCLEQGLNQCLKPV